MNTFIVLVVMGCYILWCWQHVAVIIERFVSFMDSIYKLPTRLRRHSVRPCVWCDVTWTIIMVSDIQ